MQSKITQALVEKAPLPPKGKSSLYADTEMRGFYLIVSGTKRGYYVQSLVNAKQVRTKIGDHPALTAKDARALAARTLVSMKSGVNPSEERRKARAKGITLGQALELHLASKPLSPKTVEGYRYVIENYLSDWMDKPLVNIGSDRVAVRERHQRISKKSGPATADATFRTFRAVYGRGLREHPDLPSNPTANVDFHGVKKRKVDANPDRLKAWGAAVLGLSPIRRDLHLFMLLTGMRRTAASEARKEHVNHMCDQLYVPKPKGGTARAFSLPLSEPLVDLVTHRLEDCGSLSNKSPWLFPAVSKTGHVQEVQQEELGGLTGHALRHCFGTLAVEAGVPLLELKYLLNHASGDVTMGYLNPSIEHLRSHQERASAYILEKIGLKHELGTWPPTRSNDA
ncbi:MAG TPA: tyrosine-type recombinase/integrase [Arenimonas sp.]|uniref:tyrosine-type recombinase/integrase n=1 Tax=Arenimonas sp. TaxID=1872635 RepID=UPI002D8026E8|nr:tyrosine-type recombinase/integrase [Arenimonas sp.]HEU0153014.1 tyrosine-type recombinase/integrase [Arenimonas sp.]